MGPKNSVYLKKDMVGLDRSMVDKVPDVEEEEVEVPNPLKPVLDPPLFFCFCLDFFAVVRDVDVSGTLFLEDEDKRDENPLEPSFGDIGYWEIDLAQELDPEARAVDLVTGYAREGSDGDITVTDEMAQTSWDG
eukprot:CAMPEP_0194442512 /NCGR_PEP_ID=MMETSP0176-20130528/126173_1 /TAXON_ID=216777 /ORGANISM="Proboscia alata, Strain PI-D3" /LENGTH=133 /DNA_ID=CAMNT_0039268617 /DNA_START=372 /DNA_END=774 /DNA_ORIENTATION=+